MSHLKNVSAAETPGHDSLHLHLLGAFHIARGTQSLNLPRRKAKSLLAYLVLHPQEHPREKLAALFWGDSSDTQARHSLRTALDSLRKLLGDELLLTSRDIVQLNPTFPIWVDAREFENRPSALDLYRGDLLSDLYDDWILPEREHYRGRYIAALLQLTEEMRAHSEYERAIEYAHKVLAAEPTNERAHQHLMFCFVALGNRPAALNQYADCVRILCSELAVEPMHETTALAYWIEHSPVGRKPNEAQITNLPIPLTRFIGRKRETMEVKRLVSSQRLVTLTGAGGSGKTRLAIQVATDLLDVFRDGVWWVELAALTDSALVPHAVGNALRVSEVPKQALIETLTHFLCSRQLLLVLDNCEHLVNSCAELAAALLSECPDLRILTTSREALSIIGEIVYQVPTLALPNLQRLSLVDLLMEYESIRLFVERASAVKPDFALTPQNAMAVVQVCRRLDGIPLAIELAAVRTKMLTVEHIAERLDDRFSLLTSGNRAALPRQQTLRATIDWSYDLLPEPSRKPFRRLSIFVGGFTLKAAEQVCAEAPLESVDLLNELARLVDRSLILVDQNNAGERFRILETIREYGCEKLGESGELEWLKDRHLNYFITFAEEARSKTEAHEASIWLDRLEREHDNMRAALAWSQSKEEHCERALRVAAALSVFWFLHSHLSEGRAWLERVLAKADCAVILGVIDPVRRSRAWALEGAGNLARAQGDFGAARDHYQTGIALFRETDDKLGLLTTLHGLGMVTLNLSGARARAYFEESLELAKELGYKPGIAKALLWLGHVARNECNYAAARSMYEQAIALHSDIGSSNGVIAWPLYQLGCLSGTEGNYASASSLLESSLAKFREFGDKRGEAEALAALGDVRCWQGEYAAARTVYQEGLVLNRDLGIKWATVWNLYGLGQVAFHEGNYSHAAELFREGLTFHLDQARRHYTAMCLAGLAAVLAMNNKTESALKAAQLFGASEQFSLNPLEYGHDIAVVRAQLDMDKLAGALAQGRAMTMEQAIEYAMRTD